MDDEKGQRIVPSTAPLPPRPATDQRITTPAWNEGVDLNLLAREQRATELDTHVAYYDRAAADISQALEHVEDVGSEAAVALRAVQRTMSSVASTLRRRAGELRGAPSAAVEVAE